jgi:hypothetical protein
MEHEYARVVCGQKAEFQMLKHGAKQRRVSVLQKS